MAEEKVIVIKVKKEGADKDLKSVKKDLKETKKGAEETGSAMSVMGGRAGAAFTALKTGVRTAITGFKSLKFAIAATGIGLLIIGLVAVKKAFENTEEGQNKFAKIMGVIGSLTGNFIDLISSLGEKIISVFEDPKKAISDFTKLIKDNVTNRFNGLLEIIPKLGTAIKQLWSGDFSKASETATNAIAKVVLGTDNLTQSIKESAKALEEFGKEVAEDAKKAAEIADKRAKADKIDRQLIVDRAIAARKVADLRFKSEQRDKFSVKERIKFLKEASNIAEGIANREIYANSLRLKAQIEENKLSGSNKADLDAVANLKAKGIQLDTAKLTLQKRLQTSLTSFQNEEKNNIKKINDAKIKELEKEEKERIKKVEKEAKNELDRLQKIADIQDEFKERRENELAETEVEKLELEQERKLKELEELEATEQQKSDIILFYKKKITDATLAEEVKAAEERKRIEEQVGQTKIKLLNASFKLGEALAKKGSAAAKGIAVARALQNTYQGITAELATKTVTPFEIGLKIANIATVAAIGFKSVKDILATKSDGGGGAGGGGAGNVSPPSSSAPSFNLVQGTGSNQIAESISADNARPTQAFVVGSSVTSQQELDNNKVDIGSI